MRKDEAGRFVIWVFGITLALNLLVYLTGGLQGSVSMVAVPAQMFIPGAVAVVLIRFEGSRLSDYGLRFGGLRYYALAYGVVLGMVVLHGLLANLLGWLELMPLAEGIARYAPEADIPAGWILLLAVFVGGPVTNIIFGLGEEFGWRGYLLDKLLPKGLLYAMVWGGIIWGLWHAPVILMGHNFPNHPWWGVLVMTAATVPLGAIFIWLRLVSGSAVVVGFAHGTVNALFLLGGMFYLQADLLYASLMGISGLPVLVLVAWTLFRFYPPGQKRLITAGRQPVM